MIALEGGEVAFHWKDYAHEGEQKTMKLKAIVFLRRFLLQVLPAGFVRIRHYGFLANRVCRERLELCRDLLTTITPPVEAGALVGWREVAEARPEPHACPACGPGRMVIVETLPAAPVHGSGAVEREVRPER